MGSCSAYARSRSGSNRAARRKTLDELKSDRTVQLALVQLIEIIGEAASRVDSETRSVHPNIPWQLAAGMRHRLIHGYDLIEYAVVYDTIKDDLPPLVAQLDTILPPTEVE